MILGHLLREACTPSLRIAEGRKRRINDLLLLGVKLLAEHPDVRERWRNRFRYLMVDEFQDVSKARALLLAGLMRGADKSLFAVGDDWQSINRFAGADLSTSMVTACRLARKYKRTDEKFLVDCYVQAYQAIRKYGEKTVKVVGDTEVKEVTILQNGKILRPAKDSGKKGGTRLLMGLGNCLVARKMLTENYKITEADLQHLANAAQETLNEETDGNLSNARIRESMGEFAREYFKDLKDDLVMRDGVPDILVEETAPSTWGIDKDCKVDENEPEQLNSTNAASEEAVGVDSPPASGDTGPGWYNNDAKASDEPQATGEDESQPIGEDEAKDSSESPKKSGKKKKKESVMG